MKNPRFAKLEVLSRFQLKCDPKSSIYEDFARDYAMDIFALVGERDIEGWDIPVKVGSLTATLLRFDAAENLGVDPMSAAEAHSDLAEEIYALMDLDIDRGEVGQGMNRDTVLLKGIEIRDDLKGSAVEHEAIRTALIGLGSGSSRGFLLLNEQEVATAAQRNNAALRYAQLGFKPVGIGSDLLWIDLEARKFWMP